MYMGLPYISHRPWEKQIYQIYELVGGFPAILLSSCISQNIFFHMIGNESFHFIFWNWGVSNTGLYLLQKIPSEIYVYLIIEVN